MRRIILNLAGGAFILVALAHAAGQLGPHPSDQAFVSAWQGMSATRLSMGLGTTPTLVDVWNSFSWTAVVTFTTLGLITLALARAGHRKVVPHMMKLLTTTAGLLAGVNFYYHVGLPAIVFALITIILLGAGMAAPGEAHAEE